MKIRQGFVSNSSSSSFIIVGSILELNDATLDDMNNCKIMCIGKTLGDGTDVFEIDSKEMMAFVLAKRTYIGYDPGEFALYKTFLTQREEDDDNFFKKSDLPDDEKITTFNIWQDFNSSQTLDDLFQTYDDDDDMESKMKVFFRKEKLKKIMKNED